MGVQICGSVPKGNWLFTPIPAVGWCLNPGVASGVVGFIAESTGKTLSAEG